MLSKCANPSCSTQFLYLHRGKLFRVEAEARNGMAQEPSLDFSGKKAARRLEYFWLCEECAATMTVIVEQGKLKTRPRPRAGKAVSSAAS
jgi:hypothetical protein